VLEVYDLPPVQFPPILALRGARVVRAATAFVEVAVVVACYDEDVAVSVAGAGPGFLQGLEPVEGLLDAV